ncbi:TRAP transporter small permease, partial [Rhodovulum sulfidophilum]|nr:TRAP transporter small permease [Rhodovulum sulfidophilum]
MTTAEEFDVGDLSENESARPGSRFMRPVEAIAALLLVAVIGLLLTGVVSRYLVNLPIIWIEEAASICFIWLAMLGAAISLDRNEHLRLTLFVRMLPRRAEEFVETFAMVIVGTFLVALMRDSFEYAYEE